MQQILTRAKQEIRSGRPALMFNVFTDRESDVVCGFDDEKNELYGRSSCAGLEEYAQAKQTRPLEGEGAPGAYTIPLMAVVPSDDPRETSATYIFVYDSGTSTVKKTQVSGKVGLRKNSFIATSGVDPGDIIAIAGVSFLEDGQKVKLMRKQQ